MFIKSFPENKMILNPYFVGLSGIILWIINILIDLEQMSTEYSNYNSNIP